MPSNTLRLSEERKAIMAKCVEEGWPPAKIKRIHGISEDTVKRHYPEYRSPNPLSRISSEKLELVRKAIEDGWPLMQITRTHNVSHSTLRRHFPEYRGLDLKEAGSLGGFTAMINMNARNRKKAKVS